MTPDQWRHDEARAWLDRARRDLQAARILIGGDVNAEALFHCQQAVEKAPKADGKKLQKQLVFKCLQFEDLVPAC